jgi:hypothetical protein
MSTGFKFARFAATAALCLGGLLLANADSTHSQRKVKKPLLAPLPSGPTGPVPQIPLDSIAPVAPQVSYQNGQLTIVAPNSTLGDILRAVRKQTGAEIEIPEAKERVVTHLGPGPAREVMAELLNGSRFNYVLLGSSQDASALTRVVLVAKTASDSATDSNQPAPQAQPQMSQAPVIGQPPQAPEINDAEAPDENADDNADQAAETEQPAVSPDQPEVKTPQQMLQEMQQRQLQLQQQLQQSPGQPPVQGPRVPVQPPQEQQ